MKFLVLLFSIVLCAGVNAAEINRERAHFNYQMFCQGCHAPGGASVDDSVPRMKNHVGTFINSREGREFLVRVPGSATSSLDDEELAEVLNWIVLEFSGPSLTTPFKSYTATEVGTLRERPLNEVEKYRALLLAEIAGAEQRE
jgi:hypothetical protein